MKVRGAKMRGRKLSVLAPCLALVLCVGLSPVAHAAVCRRLAEMLTDFYKTNQEVGEQALRNNRLIRMTYGDNAIHSIDGVLSVAEESSRAKAIEELLAKRTPDEANTLFTALAPLSKDARIGATRAATFGVIDDVEAGTSVFRISSVTGMTSEGKQATFVAIKNLSDAQVSGMEAMVKKAGEEIARGSFGGVYELQTAEWVRQEGVFGRVTKVAVDTLDDTVNKIDVLAEGGAFQVKSKVSLTQELTLSEINGGKGALEAFVQQTAPPFVPSAVPPIFVSSNPLAQDLIDAINDINKGIATPERRIVILAPAPGELPPVPLVGRR